MSSTLAKHAIWTKDSEFLKTYLAQCGSCERVAFELSAVSKMVRWNQQKLLQLHDEMIPTSLKEEAEKISARDGPYSLNVYTQLACRCRAVLGMHVLSPNSATQLFEGKFLVEAEKLKIVLVEASKIIEVGLLAEFDAEDFVRYEPVAKLVEIPAPSSQSAKASKLKREERIKRSEELSHDEIKTMVRYFCKVLTDLQQRIDDLENSCTSCMTVVQKITKRLPQVMRGNSQSQHIDD